MGHRLGMHRPQAGSLLLGSAHRVGTQRVVTGALGGSHLSPPSGVDNWREELATDVAGHASHGHSLLRVRAQAHLLQQVTEALHGHLEPFVVAGSNEFIVDIEQHKLFSDCPTKAIVLAPIVKDEGKPVSNDCIDYNVEDVERRNVALGDPSRGLEGLAKVSSLLCHNHMPAPEVT